MLIGNLTRDPELRYTPSGAAVCSFGLATNRSWMPSDSSERKEETEFHKVVVWNKLAELCSQLLTKGRKIYIEGRLQTRSWETPEGEKRQTTEIVAEDMVILDNRRTEGEGSGEGAREVTAAPVAPKAPTAATAAEDFSLDDLEMEESTKEVKPAPAAAPKQSLPSAEVKKEAPKEEPKEIDSDDIPF